jgi:hypothetical protein
MMSARMSSVEEGAIALVERYSKQSIEPRCVRLVAGATMYALDAAYDDLANQQPLATASHTMNSAA